MSLSTPSSYFLRKNVTQLRSAQIDDSLLTLLACFAGLARKNVLVEFDKHLIPQLATRDLFLN